MICGGSLCLYPTSSPTPTPTPTRQPRLGPSLTNCDPPTRFAGQTKLFPSPRLSSYFPYHCSPPLKKKFLLPDRASGEETHPYPVGASTFMSRGCGGQTNPLASDEKSSALTSPNQTQKIRSNSEQIDWGCEESCGHHSFLQPTENTDYS